MAKVDRAEAGRVLLGASLRHHRLEADMRLADVATSAGVSTSYLSDVERGRKLPALDTLDDLARALGVDVVSLMADVYPWGSSRAPAELPAPDDGRTLAARAREERRSAAT